MLRTFKDVAAYQSAAADAPSGCVWSPWALRFGARLSLIRAYAKHRSRSHDAVIRVYDEAGNVIETHEHAGEFRHASTLSEVTHDNHVVIAFHAHIVKAWR